MLFMLVNMALRDNSGIIISQTFGEKDIFEDIRNGEKNTSRSHAWDFIRCVENE